MEPAHLSGRSAAGLIGRAGVLVLAALAWAPVHAQAQSECAVRGLAIDAAWLRSEWREFDDRGRQLLRERGTLRESALTARGACGGWALRARLGRASGSRAYDGVSTQGQPIATTSRLRIETVSIETTRRVAAGWDAGGRLSGRIVSRDIASAGPVLGYPERFKAALLEVGVRWQGPVPSGHELALQAWAGAGPRGKVMIDLPHADPTTLDLGRTRSLAFGARIGSASQAANFRFGWQARLGWATQETSAGPARALTRNGLVVGGAAQPRIRSSEWRLGVSGLAVFD